MINTANMENTKVCIVIPVYKDVLTHNEEISLLQCRKILNRYDIIFLKPKGLIADYIAGEKCIEVKEEYLTSRKKYSDFVLSIEFYDFFKKYEYMLIYQLDAFVFSDRLLEFCSYKYDYIGAPWIYGMECHMSDGTFWYVGNGGLSLRNVKKFRQWMLSNTEEITYKKMLLPEDMVIATYGKDFLKIAPKELALKFAFDLNPKDCYQINDGNLPFGCHGWHKFECGFWQSIIDKYGYHMLVSQEITDETKVLMNGRQRKYLFDKYYKADRLQACLRSVMKNYNGVVSVWGAGQYGLSFIHMSGRCNIQIDYIYDNDSEKWGNKIEGIEIRPVEELRKKEAPAVLIAMLIPDGLKEQLKKIGLKKGVDYAFSRDLQYEMIKMGKEWTGENR